MYSAIKSQPLPAPRRTSHRNLLHRLLTKALWLEPLWLLVLAVPVTLPGLLPQRLQPFIVMALLLFWPLRWFVRRSTEQQTAVGPALGLLVAWLPINLVVGGAPTAAWQAVGYLLFGITCFIMFAKHPWLQARPMRLGWLLLALSLCMPLLAPIVQWKGTFRLFYLPIYDWFQLIPINVGETIHANILAGALVQLCIISIALALPPLQKRLPMTEGDSGRLRYVRIKWHKRDHIQRWAATLVAVLLLALLLLTQSRGAYLGMSAALVLLAVLRWPRLLWALPLLGVALGYGIYQIGPAAAFELLGADNTFGGADWRTNVWHVAGQALHDFPYTGIGIGNFRTVLPLLYPHPVLESESANHAHNLVLQIGLDLGLPGLFAYYGVVLGTIWAAGQRLRRRIFVAPAAAALPTESSRQYHKRLIQLARRHNENWALTAGAVAALVGVQVHGLLDAVTWGTKLAFLPWLCLALIALTTRSAETPPARSDPLT